MFTGVAFDLSTLNIFPVCMNQAHVLLSRYSLGGGTNVAGDAIRFALSIRGRLERARLEEGLRALVDRHEALRVIFNEDLAVSPPDRARIVELFKRTRIIDFPIHSQEVLESCQVEIHHENIEALSPDGREREIRRLIQEEAMRPFPLREPPRVRAHLFTVESEQHLLVLYLDHLVVDFFSIGILIKDLRNFLCDEELFSRSSRAASFPRFAAWQRLALTTGKFAESVCYWRDEWARFSGARLRFEDFPPALCRSQDAGAVHYDTEEHSFTPDESKSIRLFIRKAQITLAVLSLAGFSIVLSEYTGRSSIAIWSYFSNRVQPESLYAVGFFTHRHLLGIDLTSNPSGQEVINAVGKTVMGAIAHQELPLPHLWRELRCAPRFPDAGVMMDFPLAPRANVVDKGALSVNVTRLGISTSEPRFSSLGVSILDHPQALGISCAYLTGRFHRGGVQQLLSDLRTTVLRIAENPSAKVLGGLSSIRPNVPPTGLPNEMEEFFLLKGSLIPQPSSRS
jgi:hypothetical protein